MRGDYMSLADALVDFEAGTSGIGNLSCFDPFAIAQLRASIETVGGLGISLDCKSQVLPVQKEDLAEIILPLCNWLKTLTEARGDQDHRVLVSITGAAGAGKSTLSQTLCAACGQMWGRLSVQCVSMDGYSFPNTYLSAQPGVDHLGRLCTLKDVKGLAHTIDADSLLRDLRRLRIRDQNAIDLPSYSRHLHDPVPDSVAVAPECRVVIVEGLHLLRQEGRWKEISKAFDRALFLDITRSCCFERVVGRKVANGRSRESSEAHFDKVDGPTFDTLEKDKQNANIILTVHPTVDRAWKLAKVNIARRPGPDEPSTGV